MIGASLPGRNELRVRPQAEALIAGASYFLAMQMKGWASMLGVREERPQLRLRVVMPPPAPHNRAEPLQRLCPPPLDPLGPHPETWSMLLYARFLVYPHIDGL